MSSLYKKRKTFFVGFYAQDERATNELLDILGFANDIETLICQIGQTNWECENAKVENETQSLYLFRCMVGELIQRKQEQSFWSLS